MACFGWRIWPNVLRTLNKVGAEKRHSVLFLLTCLSFAEPDQHPSRQARICSATSSRFTAHLRWAGKYSAAECTYPLLLPTLIALSRPHYGNLRSRCLYGLHGAHAVPAHLHLRDDRICVRSPAAQAYYGRRRRRRRRSSVGLPSGNFRPDSARPPLRLGPGSPGPSRGRAASMDRSQQRP